MARNLGTLTYSLIAEIGGFERGLDKAGRAADKRSKEIQASLTKIGGAVGVGLTAAGAAVADWTRDVAMSAIEVERLATLAGTSNKTFQELAFGAKNYGIENEKLADILKDVQDKVGDFMQTGGGAMADFFEKVAPKVGVTAEQFKKLSGADALQLYVSSLETARLPQSEMTFYMEAIASDATALLPLLRNNGSAYQELAKQAHAYGVVLDSELIEQSKELRRQVQELEAMYTGFKNEIGQATIPVLVALGKSVKDVASQTNELEGAVDGLRKSDGLRLFAEDAGRQMAKTIDQIATTKREFQAIVDAAGLAGRGTKAFFSGDWEELRKAEEDFRKRFMGPRDAPKPPVGRADAQWQGDAERAYEAQLGAAARSRFAQNDPRRVFDVPSIKAQVDALFGNGGGSGAKPTKGGGNSAAQEAVAQLSADLEAIKRSRDTLLNTVQNSEQMLQALRSAGLTEEGEYYREKGLLLDKQTTAEVQALEKTIARLQQEKVGGKDAINVLKQIETAQAELAKVRENAATQSKIFSIEEQAAFKQIENSILAAKQAAQGYLNTMNRGLNAEIEGAGLGNKARERTARGNAVEQDFERQRQDLLNMRRQTELISGPLGPEAEKAYKNQLAIINDTNAQALQSLTAYYNQVDALQKDWKVGAMEALANYADEAGNLAKQMEDIVGSAFKGMEDSLVQFTKTGKLDMKDLVDSILADFTRMAVRSQITGPLADLMNNSIKGANTGSDTSWLGGLLTSFSGLFGGARANGGPVLPNTLYKVNERGPEMFQMDDGTQLLMTGARGGGIVPNHRLGGGGQFSQVNNFHINGQVDRRTMDQIAGETGRRTRLSARLS